ncbi:LysR substrate-binding domain-containing protein [uncultured Ruegeria sp.]|uniref:LysR substrate-binding domain-containing protein n=1 Tax=uncultured Ruegeria sp. TaxID=259304 RepID=UPI002605ADA7|nr:LysR substrate-binding domain-containing protein [uncultured Ruegeria sp.]
MLNRPYDLPPVSSLISFEAAARHVSFKTAAEELNVTPAAISHQVKALENELQSALFLRHHRGVELTESGAYLLVALQRGLEGISEALGQLRRQYDRKGVTIRSTTAVSSLWLTPRLAQFWKRHGHVSVTQVVTDLGIDTSRCDLSIHYGDSSRETGIFKTLFHDNIMALCSPRFAEHNPIERVEDFARVPLIHLDAPDTGWTDWRAWTRKLGYDGPLNSAHRVNNYTIALQAAQDDMGAVLGWEGLTSDLINSGKLVRLLPQTTSSQLDFYVKLHNTSSDRAKLVFKWLSEAADETG